MGDVISPSPMVSSGLLPVGTLLESLINISNEVLSIENIDWLQIKNISKMMRKITVLSSLFEEIQETEKPLPPSSILCLNELFSVIRRAKILIKSCGDGSRLWNLMQTENISNQFYALVKEMARALDILPLSLLNLTDDTREQVELLHKQAKRFELFVDRGEIQRRDELVHLIAINNGTNRKNKSFTDFTRIIDIISPSEFDEEISKLEVEAEKQAGTGGLIVVCNINNLISLVKQTKATIITQDEHTKKRKTPTNTHHHDHSMTFNVPDEFRCPILLDLMQEPVIVASGHTYDKISIAQWINTGHHTCPKTGQRLIHMALIQNYALKSLIHQWCHEKNIPITESKTQIDRRSSETAIDHISATKASVDAVKETAEFLVGKLATGSPDIQRQAAYELRLLAKTGMENRRMIAEAGAIPFLSTLLTSPDARIQENAITALLNLSIYENNKILIMAAGAIDKIVDVLQSGLTMEAKENAAASIFSLSLMHDYKITIGAHPSAIQALVSLLEEGTTAGKKDASTALYNLAVINANRRKAVQAGAVPLLIALLTDDKAGITDDILAILALLSGCHEGFEAIRKSRVVVSLLIDLLRFGSCKGKENSITLLLRLCKDGGEEAARRVLMNPRSVSSLKSLAADGSLKARRKADALLRILNRCCC